MTALLEYLELLCNVHAKQFGNIVKVSMVLSFEEHALISSWHANYSCLLQLKLITH